MILKQHLISHNVQIVTEKNIDAVFYYHIEKPGVLLLWSQSHYMFQTYSSELKTVPKHEV